MKSANSWVSRPKLALLFAGMSAVVHGAAVGIAALAAARFNANALRPPLGQLPKPRRAGVRGG